MSKRQATFTLTYWGLLIAALLFISYTNGKQEFDECEITEGKVFSYVDVLSSVRRWSKNRINIKRPQIEFSVAGSRYEFTAYNTVLDSGETVNVLYHRDSPYNSQIYTIWFWIDFGIIIPFFLMGGFIFSMIWIKFSNYGKKPVILKGEFDDFTTNK